MQPVPAFLLGIVLLVVLAACVLVFVRRPMRRILVELCGAEHRADFWQHLFEVGLTLTVLFLAMFFPPGRGDEVGFFDFLGMFRAGLFGLLAALAVLAIAMMTSIGSYERKLRRTAPLPRDQNGAPLA